MWAVVLHCGHIGVQARKAWTQYGAGVWLETVCCKVMLLSAMGLQNYSWSWKRAEYCFVAGLERVLDGAPFLWLRVDTPQAHINGPWLFSAPSLLKFSILLLNFSIFFIIFRSNV